MRNYCMTDLYNIKFNFTGDEESINAVENSIRQFYKKGEETTGVITRDYLLNNFLTGLYDFKSFSVPASYEGNLSTFRFSKEHFCIFICTNDIRHIMLNMPEYLLEQLGLRDKVKFAWVVTESTNILDYCYYDPNNIIHLKDSNFYKIEMRLKLIDEPNHNDYDVFDRIKLFLRDNINDFFNKTINPLDVNNFNNQENGKENMLFGLIMDEDSLKSFLLHVFKIGGEDSEMSLINQIRCAVNYKFKSHSSGLNIIKYRNII